MTVLSPSADITGAGGVDMDDLMAMADVWLTISGDTYYNIDADLNRDGEIDNADIDILSENWLTTGVITNRNYYYHFDGLGSVIAVTDSLGNVVEEYRYTVYGQADNTGNIGNPYMFTARRFDSETGLYYYRARYYSATIGRFMQTDPIGYKDGINWYLYCRNNPLAWIDPWGLCGTDDSYTYINNRNPNIDMTGMPDINTRFFHPYDVYDVASEVERYVYEGIIPYNNNFRHSLASGLLVQEYGYTAANLGVSMYVRFGEATPFRNEGEISDRVAEQIGLILGKETDSRAALIDDILRVYSNNPSDYTIEPQEYMNLDQKDLDELIIRDD